MQVQYERLVFVKPGWLTAASLKMIIGDVY